MKKEVSQKVIFGGWYQRTTLHLTEVYELLANGRSRLKLNKAKLRSLRNRLDLKTVERQFGKFEMVYAVTKSGIEISYYEDGLYVLEMNSLNIEKTAAEIRNYFNERFSPAINYIFSLGAPVPKILSNIKDDHPIIVGKVDRYHRTFRVDKKYGRVYSEYKSKDTSVYKTEKYIFVVTSNSKEKMLDQLIGTQIFFREFKDQLHKYLNIHRRVWEEIRDIKEMEEIKGSEIAFYRNKLDRYEVTIDLIRNRINQMSTYAHTRSNLAKESSFEDNLRTLFQYRFEDLFNTLNYIKEIWGMTHEYVKTAISVLNEIGDEAGRGGIRSIQILASIGVVTGIIGYLSRDALPTVSWFGAGYLIALGVIGLLVDQFLKLKAKNKKYNLNFVEREREI
ncbi:MAG: hypothetical protein ABIB79_03670 [archaeon]